MGINGYQWLLMMGINGYQWWLSMVLNDGGGSWLLVVLMVDSG